MVNMRGLALRARVLLQRRRLVQVGLLIGLWWTGEAVVRLTGFPLPGSVVGLALLLALLFSGRLPSSWFSRGADGLLDHLLLFFVPATMTLLQHRELFGLTGLKIIAIVLVGTVLVMAGTAMIVELCLRWSLSRDA